MIKVEHTRTISINRLPITDEYIDLVTHLVTDAKLVLVECNQKEAIFYKAFETDTYHLYSAGKYLTFQCKFYKPILISETEKIEVGDWYWNKKTNTIHQYTTRYFAEVGHKEYECFKILALPEHFAPQQLQMIVDGKLKEGKCLIECESFRDLGVIAGDRGMVNHIKLNPHITIYPVEEKMYTRDDFNKFCQWIDENWRRVKTKKGSGWLHVGDFYKQDKPIKTKDLAKKWFEQSVK